MDDTFLSTDNVPTKTKTKRKKPSSDLDPSSGEQVYCICRKGDNGRWMIGCDFCDDWFHGSCIDMNEAKAELVVKFACPICREKGHLGVWKRKCRLPGCNRPIMPGSKYCKKEHGREFLNSIINHKLTGMKKSDLAQLVSVYSFDNFKSLHGNDVNTGLDQPQVSDSNTSTIKHWEKRLEILKASKENVKRLNEQIIASTGVKKSDICGFDFRLMDSRWESSDYAFSDDPTVVCQKERRKCLKHTGWNAIMTDGANLYLTEARKQ